MKKNLSMWLLALAMLMLASCGGGSNGYSGVFGELFNAKYEIIDNDKISEFYDNYNSKLAKTPIPIEVDKNVPLETAGINRVEDMSFYASAKTTRGGVYSGYTSWAEPKNDDESYEFDLHFAVLLCDKDGNPIYSVPLAIYGLQRSTLRQRIVNPIGTEVELNFGIDYSQFYVQKLSVVERIRIVDANENGDLIKQLSQTLKEEKNAFDEQQAQTTK